VRNKFKKPGSKILICKIVAFVVVVTAAACPQLAVGTVLLPLMALLFCLLWSLLMDFEGMLTCDAAPEWLRLLFNCLT